MNEKLQKTSFSVCEIKMNILHKAVVCWSCKSFNTQTNKCSVRNIIVNSSFLSCKE